MAVSSSSQTIESALDFYFTKSETIGLEFVTISNPKDVLNISNRRRIRRHARKSAPDAERWRRKAFSRTFELAPTQSPSSHPIFSKVEHDDEDNSLFPVPILGLDDRSLFPVETTSRMRELLSFVCHKATAVYNPTFRSWFRIALTDPSAFYMTLSNAALEAAGLWNGETGDQLREDNEALNLYNLSLQDVQKRLQDPSDGGALGGILGFACRDVTTGHFTRSTTHLRGLGEVLNAREILLARTTDDFRIMLIDIDISNSFAQDTPPLFPAPTELCPDIFDHYFSTPSPALDTTLQIWLDTFPGDADLISAFRGVAALTMFVNENSSTPDFWMKDEVTRMTLLVLHRLLSVKRIDLSMTTKSEFEAREVIRLALMVFMGRYKVRLGIVHGGNPASYGRRVKELMDQRPDWSNFLDFQLWTAVVCGVDQSQPTYSQEWYSDQIVSIMLQNGLRDWDSAMNIVRSLVWADGFPSDGVDMLGAAVETKLTKLINDSNY